MLTPELKEKLETDLKRLDQTLKVLRAQAEIVEEDSIQFQAVIGLGTSFTLLHAYIADLLGIPDDVDESMLELMNKRIEESLEWIKEATTKETTKEMVTL